MHTQRNVDRLVRSLVGVIDYAAEWTETGQLARLDILRDRDIEDHQLVRNVISGIGAGCGIRLARTAVRVHTDAAVFTAAIRTIRAADSAAGPSGPADRAPGDAATNGAANARGSTAARNGTDTPVAGSVTPNGQRAPRPAAGQDPGRQAAHEAWTAGGQAAGRNGASPARRAAARPGAGTSVVASEGCGPAPRVSDAAAVRFPGATRLQLERVDLENRGATLRCRVVLSLGEQVYSAIAEVPAGPTAEAEVAARVTLDALRAGALVCARLDGVGFTSIGDNTFVVVAIRDAGEGAPRAAAEHLGDSMARAASSAVVAAVGPITTLDLEAAGQRLGSLNHQRT